MSSIVKANLRPKSYKRNTNVSFLKISVAIFGLFYFIDRVRSEKSEGGQ